MINRLNEHIVFRYIISGGTGATVDLGLLYILNTIFSIHYIIAAVAAFVGAFGVSFFLHKMWTFRGPTHHNTHRQVALYLCTSLFGLALNTLLMYLFVGHIHMIVLVAQIFAGALVACCTFFLSRNYVFKHRPV